MDDVDEEQLIRAQVIFAACEDRALWEKNALLDGGPKLEWMMSWSFQEWLLLSATARHMGVRVFRFADKQIFRFVQADVGAKIVYWGDEAVLRRSLYDITGPSALRDAYKSWRAALKPKEEVTCCGSTVYTDVVDNPSWGVPQEELDYYVCRRELVNLNKDLEDGIIDGDSRLCKRIRGLREMCRNRIDNIDKNIDELGVRDYFPSENPWKECNVW